MLYIRYTELVNLVIRFVILITLQLPASWEIYMQVKKQQLEPDMDWFQIGKGVLQGCILSPCLFNLYAEYIMQNARLNEAQAGVKISGRNASNLRHTDDTQFSSAQSLSHVQLFATPWITARQASLSITNTQNSLKFMSIEWLMSSSHFLLCHPLLLLPPNPS